MACHRPSRVRCAARRSAAFNLAKACSNRVEVGAVRRQIDELGALCGDRRRDAGDLVAAQVVEQDDVVRSQGRGQHLLDVSAEALAIDDTVEHARSSDPAAAQTGDQGRHFPMPVRHRCQ
jgi:hypothetical protein